MRRLLILLCLLLPLLAGAASASDATTGAAIALSPASGWLRNLSPPQLHAMGIDGQGPRWRATLALHERLHEGMDELLQLARHSGHPAALEHMPRLQVLREQLLLALQGFLPQSVPRTTAAD
ncbi:MAG: hypothetical protein Q7T22_08580 [Serpentinimonas sp.]|nr:hypothetical protein [Serpentinimonas sp.]